MTEEEFMMTAILNCRRVDLVSGPPQMTDEQRSLFNGMLKRRAQGEPLQYIVGECEFMGIPLKVDPHVLIPRPETEIMVDCAINAFSDAGRPVKALDLGVGSGNIAISLVKKIKDCTVTAIDISKEALQTAAENASINGVGQHIEFIHADMVEFLNRCSQNGIAYDLIIANPPYIAEESMGELPLDVQQEPAVALNGGRDGLKFYQPVISASHRSMVDGGMIFLEFADDQGGRIASIFHDHPQYQFVRFFKDYTGTERIVSARNIKNG